MIGAGLAHNVSYGSRGQNSVGLCPALFHAIGRSTPVGEFINHGLSGGTGWSTTDVMAAPYRAPLDFILPSTWNSEAVLLPIQAFSTVYGSAKVALVLDVVGARACRIDNFKPGNIITLGSDRWKIYPWYLKAAAESSTSSGRLGWAIRYDGP